VLREAGDVEELLNRGRMDVIQYSIVRYSTV